MPSTSTLAACRIISSSTFEQLRSLIKDSRQLLPPQAPATIITEAVLIPVESRQAFEAQEFVLLASKSFSVLLLGKPNDARSLFHTELTFDPAAIASFLQTLANQLHNNPHALRTLAQIRRTLRPNDPALQSEFTLQLIEILSFQTDPLTEPLYPYVSVCQPVEQALRQQVERERVLNQVIAQIRQSLELPVILETAVQQVRQSLAVDRLVIYQLHPATLPPGALPTSVLSSPPAYITYEARASENLPSILNLEESHFAASEACLKKYRQGFTLAVDDVEVTYPLSPCLLKLLQHWQVRALMVVPIVVQEELWGLLIAHQCFTPRQWIEGEQEFLQYIAAHLSLAVSQAELYAQLQQQKQTLEQRVIARTQELHDALLSAQSASRAKSEFLATMSHELRTPLTCVIGLSATLLRWSFGHLSPKQRQYLQTIHASGEHLLELINDILELSQVESGKAVLSISEFSPVKLGYELLQELQMKARQGEVRLEMELQPPQTRDRPTLFTPLTADHRFPADQRRVQQILLNLLSNAVKFTPAGGRVILRLWQETQHLMIQVEDTGIGIPEHQRPLLFQKFQQLDPTYHRKYEGTGLGLALTKQLVELHGGWIEVESTVGVGSTFTVRLPAQPLAIAAANLEIPVNAAHLSRRIVLIEDEEELALLICDLLNAAGHQVVWMMEGLTALKQIELIQPSLVITSMELPDIDGMDVIYTLRQASPASAIQLLALLSANTLPEQVPAIAAVVQDYLIKPVKPEQLLDKVTGLVNRAGSSLPAVS